MPRPTVEDLIQLEEDVETLAHNPEITRDDELPNVDELPNGDGLGEEKGEGEGDVKVANTTREEVSRASASADGLSEASSGAAMPPVDPPIATFPGGCIRRFHPSDAAALQRLGNNVRISRFMRNSFPAPYTAADAEDVIRIRSSCHMFAICCYSTSTSTSTHASASAAASPSAPTTATATASATAEFCGSIGLKSSSDIGERTMEVGYWVGEPFWGRGLATGAVAAFSPWVFAAFPHVLTLQGSVFSGNPASARVLAKAGYRFEGVLRQAVSKNGEALDDHRYSLLRGECEGVEEG